MCDDSAMSIRSSAKWSTERVHISHANLHLCSMHPLFKMGEIIQGGCYPVLLFNFPRQIVPSIDRGKVKARFSSDYKENVRLQNYREADGLVQRTKDWGRKDLGFLPASTSDQTHNLEKIKSPQECSVSYSM